MSWFEQVFSRALTSPGDKGSKKIGSVADQTTDPAFSLLIVVHSLKLKYSDGIQKDCSY